MARGEIVLVVHGASLDELASTALQDREARRVLTALLAELPVSQAARLAAQITGAQPQGTLRARAATGAGIFAGVVRTGAV